MRDAPAVDQSDAPEFTIADPTGEPSAEAVAALARLLLERVEPIKPSDIARRKADVELLRGLQDFGKEIKIGDRRSA